MNGLAVAYADDGCISEAVSLLESTYAARRASLGEDDIHTLRSHYFLARMYGEIQGRVNEALDLQERCLSGCLWRLGRTNADSIRCMHSLGTMYNWRGEEEKVTILFHEALAANIDLFEKGHQRVNFELFKG